MIDTVTYKCFLALVYPGSWPRGWKGWKPVNTEDSLKDQDYAMQNDLPGIRVFIHADVIIKVEADLPKLLYGHNGRLLKSQEDIDAALYRLRLALETISRPLGILGGYYPGDRLEDFSTYYTRVDLVWQFDLAPELMILGMRNAKHPEINKRTGQWQDQTLVFPGTAIRISMYDKKAKERVPCRHNVMRVEIQLRDDKISDHFGLGQHPLKMLMLDAVYSVYRSVLLRFGSDLVPDPAAKGSIEDFLAWAVVKLPDEDPIGIYCATKKMCRRKSRDFRKKVGQRVPALVNLSWSDLLPPSHLPSVVEISSPGRESRVDHFFEDIERWLPARSA